MGHRRRHVCASQRVLQRDLTRDPLGQTDQPATTGMLDTEPAVEAALALVSSEEFSIHIGAIQPLGFRLIGRMAPAES